MECLEDYIGIRGCSDSEPESDLYINDLPGISLETLDKIADAEQVTYLNVWEDVKRRALKRFKTHVNSWLSQRYQIRKLAQSANLGRRADTSSVTASAAEDRGFAFWLSNDDDLRISNLHIVHVQELALYLSSAANTTVKIYNIKERIGDIYYGDAEFTYTVTGVAGWNRIPVSQDFKAELGILCVYDATSINSVELTIPDRVDSYCSCARDCFGCEVDVEGIKVTRPFTSNNVTRGTNTFGLSGIISLECSWEQFICDNRQNFAVALWYLLGYEYATERLYSLRLNRFVTIDREKVKEMRDEYLNVFKDEIERALAGVEVKEDCCVSCNAQVKQLQAVL